MSPTGRANARPMTGSATEQSNGSLIREDRKSSAHPQNVANSPLTKVVWSDSLYWNEMCGRKHDCKYFV
jgi:hypothetical protein